MIDWLASLGAQVLRSYAHLGRASMFLWRVLLGLPGLVLRPGLVVAQLYSIGVLSLVIIAVSGTFVGMVLALQFYYVIVDFGQTEILGQATALAMLRELGPVVTALLFAGRAGSALAAEIGLMKATEQLSSMEMMAVDPERRVIAPRFLAGVISVPLLTAMASVLGIIGSYIVGTRLLGIDGEVIWTVMQSKVSLTDDVLNGLTKSAVFGFVAMWIALFEGYDAEPTSEGVSRATTRTVVHTSLAVLALDFVLTALMFD